MSMRCSGEGKERKRQQLQSQVNLRKSSSISQAHQPLSIVRRRPWDLLQSSSLANGRFLLLLVGLPLQSD